MKDIKLALVGCGRISQRHIEAIQSNEGIKIAVVCDIIEDRAKEKAQLLGCEYVTQIKDIKGVDVITIATPSGKHPEHAAFAAENCDASYIVCEKPLSLTVRETVEMYKRIEKAGKKLLPVFQNRYNPLVAFTKNLIETGKLGKIYQFDCNVFWNRNDDYFNIDWHGTKDLDGGVLYTQASHYVDMLHYFFGKVVEYKGMGGSLRGLEVYDTISSILRFENGAVGTLNATVSVYRTNYQTELTVIGSKGTLRLSGTNLNEIVFWDVEGMGRPDMDFKIDHQYGKGHDIMYKYIVEKRWDMFPAYEDVLSGIGLMEKLSF
jgi:UDP-N-acetyl-2-amino-2-deoxyglucuronate dehydrogenase